MGIKQIGYVLSGSGARVFAHLGVLKYMEELPVRLSAISGTNDGAIAGALYAAGKDAEEILNLIENSSYFGWSNINWRSKGIFSMDILRMLLREAIVADDFKALKIPFYATATDLNKGIAVTLSEGKLFDAIIASCSVPVVFKSV